MKKNPYSKPGTIWLELPSNIPLEYSKKRKFKSKLGQDLMVTLTLRNDIIKAYQNDFYDRAKSYTEALNSKVYKPETIKSDYPEFLTESQLEKRKENNEFLFAIMGNTFAEVKVKMTRNGTPELGLITSFIFSWLNEIVDAYRVVAVPYRRYPLDNISEANLNHCWINCGKQRTKYGFSVRQHNESPKHHFRHNDDFQVQERFNKLVGKTTLSEREFSRTFPLVHQRKFKEALIIASSACELLAQELVMLKAPSEKIGSILWRTHRTRFEDVLKEVFPILGIAKISDSNKGLWDKLIKARSLRNISAHGISIDQDEDAYLPHLQTFFELANWIVDQSDGQIRKWNFTTKNIKTSEELKKQF